MKKQNIRQVVRKIVREEIEKLNEGKSFETEIWKGNESQIWKQFKKRKKEKNNWMLNNLHVLTTSIPNKKKAEWQIRTTATKNDIIAVPLNDRNNIWLVGGYVA